LQSVRVSIQKTGLRNDTAYSIIYNDIRFGSAMGFLDNLESSTYMAKLQDNVSIIPNDGLALKVFQEFCCDSCSCKSENDHKKTEVNDLLQSTTSFEE
jgi:hypothetical protein